MTEISPKISLKVAKKWSYRVESGLNKYQIVIIKFGTVLNTFMLPKAAANALYGNDRIELFAAAVSGRRFLKKL